MNPTARVEPARPPIARRIGRTVVIAVIGTGALLLLRPASAVAGQAQQPQAQQQATASTADKDRAAAQAPPIKKDSTKATGASQTRDPNGYADGYTRGTMPGMEQADRIIVGKLLADQIELASGPEGRSGAWDVSASYGRDVQKLWVRTEGGIVNGTADYSTNVEALWWRAFSPFWATLVGVRQDVGPGAHTHAAFGVEGLAPYWFDVQATGYVANDGMLSARLKASYDLLFSNRLILSPEVESNLYSRQNPARLLGSGVGNVELQGRLRYEVSRKFAPYVGVDWDLAVGSTGDRLRAAGRHSTDLRIVAGLRAWR